MVLKDIVPWGRSFDEYRDIFSLTDTDLNKTILGCGDGPASFNSVLTSQRGNVVSVDPIYRFTACELRSRIQEAYNEIMPQVKKNKHMYIWDSIPSVQALGEIRTDAMHTFIADYEAGKLENRYLPESLPDLSFKDNEFDLALCSHYLFLYSEQVSLKRHIASIKELCRVAFEVRVYPLLSLDGELSPHLKEVISKLSKDGLVCTKENVKYQFQKGADQMLVIQSV